MDTPKGLPRPNPKNSAAAEATYGLRRHEVAGSVTTPVELPAMDEIAVLANVECCGEWVPLSLLPGDLEWCPFGCGTRFRIAVIRLDRLWPGEPSQ
jgi:hypothetical protein